MNYRNANSICALYDYLQEEACNELLDLSPWLNQGWPQTELRMTVMLLRKVMHSPSPTQDGLIAAGFSPSLLKCTLPLLSERHLALSTPSTFDTSLNHLYDPALTTMKFVSSSGCSLHRLSAKWMKVTTQSDRAFEWVMLKKDNHMVGWVLMPLV